MELTKRLERIANYVPIGNIVADVGTDHGYIPIYLVMKGISPKAYAMDIRKGPLEKAKENITFYKVENYVEVILSDGLKELNNRQVDTLIIAGMGGMLINKILTDGQNKLQDIPNLILSPHLDTDQVRRKVHQLGYSITQEDFLKEEGKFYPIIICQHGEEHYNDLEYEYGKSLVNSCHKTYQSYLNLLFIQNNNLIEKLQNTKTPSSLKRLIELEKVSKDISEVIKWLH